MKGRLEIAKLDIGEVKDIIREKNSNFTMIELASGELVFDSSMCGSSYDVSRLLGVKEVKVGGKDEAVLFSVMSNPRKEDIIIKGSKVFFMGDNESIMPILSYLDRGLFSSYKSSLEGLYDAIYSFGFNPCDVIDFFFTYNVSVALLENGMMVLCTENYRDISDNDDFFFINDRAKGYPENTDDGKDYYLLQFSKINGSYPSKIESISVPDTHTCIADRDQRPLLSYRAKGEGYDFFGLFDVIGGVELDEARVFSNSEIVGETPESVIIRKYTKDGITMKAIYSNSTRPSPDENAQLESDGWVEGQLVKNNVKMFSFFGGKAFCLSELGVVSIIDEVNRTVTEVISPKETKRISITNAGDRYSYNTQLYCLDYHGCITRVSGGILKGRKS